MKTLQIIFIFLYICCNFCLYSEAFADYKFVIDKNRSNDIGCSDIKIKNSNTNIEINIPNLIDGIMGVYIDNKELTNHIIKKNNISDPESGGIIHIDIDNVPQSIKLTCEGEVECYWNRKIKNFYNDKNICKKIIASDGGGRWTNIGIIFSPGFSEDVEVFINGKKIKNKDDLTERERKEYHKYDIFNLDDRGYKMMTIIPSQTKIYNIRNILFIFDDVECLIDRRSFR